jgi:hypothetical protein
MPKQLVITMVKTQNFPRPTLHLPSTTVDMDVQHDWGADTALVQMNCPCCKDHVLVAVTVREKTAPPSQKSTNHNNSPQER